MKNVEETSHQDQCPGQDSQNECASLSGALNPPPHLNKCASSVVEYGTAKKEDPSHFPASVLHKTSSEHVLL